MIRRLLISLFLLGASWLPAMAQTSTIDPSVPAANSPLNSAPIRQNFIAAYNDINTLYGLVTGGGTLTGTLNFATGTATLTPSVDHSGTLNTTAVAGGHEFDGTAFYDTSVASSRQVRVDEQFETLTSPFTLVSQTGAQKALNATTNGALAVNALTTYRFHCSFNLTSLSATSNSYGFAWGLTTATLTSQSWYSNAQKGGTSVATPGATFQTFNTAANTALTAATTGTTGTFETWGKISVNAAGSVFPEISLQTAAAAVVGVGSGCRLWPIGTNTVTNVGNWN